MHSTQKPRAIIHLDMDCFYAAIEVRDRPELKGEPVGVGVRFADTPRDEAQLVFL